MTITAQELDTTVDMLDGDDPGWVFRIDLDRLDISSPDDCVVGQLYGGDLKRSLLELYGSSGAPAAAFAAQTEAWREKILSLRAVRPDLSHLPVVVPPIELMSPVDHGWDLDDALNRCTRMGPEENEESEPDTLNEPTPIDPSPWREIEQDKAAA